MVPICRPAIAPSSSSASSRLASAWAARAASTWPASVRRLPRRIELDPFLEDEIFGVAKPGLAPLKKGALAPAKLAEFMLLAREPGSSSQQIIDEELRA